MKEQLQKIELTMQEIWAAAQHKVHKNRKKYNRKKKHPKVEEDDK